MGEVLFGLFDSVPKDFKNEKDFFKENEHANEVLIPFKKEIINNVPIYVKLTLIPRISKYPGGLPLFSLQYANIVVFDEDKFFYPKLEYQHFFKLLEFSKKRYSSYYVICDKLLEMGYSFEVRFLAGDGLLRAYLMIVEKVELNEYYFNNNALTFSIPLQDLLDAEFE